MWHVIRGVLSRRAIYFEQVQNKWDACDLSAIFYNVRRRDVKRPFVIRQVSHGRQAPLLRGSPAGKLKIAALDTVISRKQWVSRRVCKQLVMDSH